MRDGHSGRREDGISEEWEDNENVGGSHYDEVKLVRVLGRERWLSKPIAMCKSRHNDQEEGTMQSDRQ